jgi:cell division protein FtsB
MSTRLKRRSIWRPLGLAALLVACQVYLGYSVVTGQFGIQSRDVLETDVLALNARSAALQAEIDAHRHKIDLFQASRLDPDLVSERARALLAMAEPEDVIIMLDPATAKPIFGSPTTLTQDELMPIIEDGVDR